MIILLRKIIQNNNPAQKLFPIFNKYSRSAIYVLHIKNNFSWFYMKVNTNAKCRKSFIKLHTMLFNSWFVCLTKVDLHSISLLANIISCALISWIFGLFQLAYIQEKFLLFRLYESVFEYLFTLYGMCCIGIWYGTYFNLNSNYKTGRLMNKNIASVHELYMFVYC